MSEKTEKPTEGKFRRARSEGQVSMSHDLNAAITIACGFLIITTASGFLAEHLKTLMYQALQLSIRHSKPELWQGAVVILKEAGLLLMPFIIATLLGPSLGGLLQTRFNIAFKKLTPKFTSINPVSGIKRIFSLRTLLELSKTVLKAVIIIFVVWQGIVHYLPMILGTGYLPLDNIAKIGWKALYMLIGLGVITMTVFGVADVGLQRLLYIRDQKMTKDEVKREFKENEGNPEIKHQQRQFFQEIIHSPPQKRLAAAKVVVVNPTHYAVALAYTPDIGVPHIVAKGVDKDALELRQAATAMGLPIISNPPLARTLYTIELNETIPEELFETIAAIMRWVDGLGQHHRNEKMSPNDGNGMPL